MATAINFRGGPNRAHREPLPEPVCDYVILDVETLDASAEEVERDFAENYEPPKNYVDPAKLEAHRAQAREKWEERAALLDAAPVGMVGLMFADRTYLLHGLKDAKPKWFGKNGERNSVSLEGFRGERALLEGVGSVLGKKASAETMLVGHNIFGFDLGKLRLATVRQGLVLPEALRVRLLEDDEKQRVFDTMAHFCRFFAKHGQIMISQEAMLERLGIEPILKGVASGADVPKLLAAGKIAEVATKLLADLVGVREAFVRMTGRER